VVTLGPIPQGKPTTKTVDGSGRGGGRRFDPCRNNRVKTHD